MVLSALLACNPTAAPPRQAETAPSNGPRIVALGTVQDGGLPHAACSCERCDAARTDPARRRRVSSLAIRAGQQSWLIDATPDIRLQLDALREPGAASGVNRSPLAGVFLTHAHMGHYTGLAFFGYEAVHTSRLPVYCTPSLAELLRTNAPWSQLVAIENIELRPTTPGQTVELTAGISITPVAVPHRDELSDTVGFLISGPNRKVLYVPDTDSWTEWDPPLTQQLENIDTAILDGTFFSTAELPNRDITEIGHPLIRSSMDLLEQQVQEGKLEVHFTHLNHSNPALDPNSKEHKEIKSRGFHILEENQEIPL